MPLPIRFVMSIAVSLAGDKARRYQLIGWLLDDLFPEREFNVVEVGPKDAVPMALWPERMKYLGVDDQTGPRKFSNRQTVVKGDLSTVGLPTKQDAYVCVNHSRWRPMDVLLARGAETVQQSTGVVIVRVPSHMVERTVEQANHYFAKVGVMERSHTQVVICRLPRRTA